MARSGPARVHGKALSREMEWPSIVLCFGVYSSYLTLTWWHAMLPRPAFAALGAMLLALQSSMQHEFIHGHPTPWRKLNRALAFAPLCLWLPFESYRRSHLVHHRDERLTDPYDDPETYYWTADAWAAIGPLGRAFIRVHSTLAGRLLFGPAWNIARYLSAQARALWRGDRITRRLWLAHGVGVAGVLIWLMVCRIHPLFYLCCIVYPAASILLLRSFAEHRAEQELPGRSAIVERAPVLGFIFLFNNLHAAHHESPLVPWYRLPRWYRENRTRLVAQNGGLVYRGYAEVARRYLLVPHHVSVHPSQAASPMPQVGGEAGAPTPSRGRRFRSGIFQRSPAKNTSVAVRSVS